VKPVSNDKDVAAGSEYGSTPLTSQSIAGLSD
jgi:hypothetical protein